MARGWRIGVDARSLRPPLTGTGVHLWELLRHLTELSPDTQLFGYSSQPLPTLSLPILSLPNLSLPAASFHPRPGRGPTARFGALWLQTGLLRQLRRDGVELFWGPLQVLPLRLLGRLPTVVTLHDLVFHRHPETLSVRDRLVLPGLARRSLRGADRVVAVSHSTARSGIEELGLARERVRVIPNAAGEAFRPLPLEAAQRRVRELCPVRREYLLFVGTLEPRKNLAGLLDAVALLVGRGRFDGDVVVVGGQGWRDSGLEGRSLDPRLRDRLILAGYVENADLPAFYSAARLFALPSRYEGFGIPVLEAMACGAPVVCSDRDPFPEVAGDAARLASLDQPGALARALEEVWNDDELRGELVRRGKERAARYSWRESAQKLLAVFDELLG